MLDVKLRPLLCKSSKLTVQKHNNVYFILKLKKQFLIFQATLANATCWPCNSSTATDNKCDVFLLQDIVNVNPASFLQHTAFLP